MKMKKTKIIIDADIIIHFYKAGYFSILHKIFPAYEYIVLSIILDEEITGKTLQSIRNHILLLGKIKIEKWNPTGEILHEFALLLKKYGKGESACMAYCKYNHDIVASSNLKDIKDYCDENEIVYITTMDFLYEAFRTGILTEAECNGFIADVIRKGSILPDIKIEKYKPRILIHNL
jgi:predicted nucleic acid-binding protein